MVLRGVSRLRRGTLDFKEKNTNGRVESPTVTYGEYSESHAQTMLMMSSRIDALFSSFSFTLSQVSFLPSICLSISQCTCSSHFCSITLQITSLITIHPISISSTNPGDDVSEARHDTNESSVVIHTPNLLMVLLISSLSLNHIPSLVSMSTERDVLSRDFFPSSIRFVWHFCPFPILVCQPPRVARASVFLSS
ncbi:hypothetical protein BDQ12DRAFT_1042 [Crucibulum laeve]|uniref:Uncharacterized protein n=1 Tax=Crucibulum laeve TaxID=68775 RepID=A0A5C3MJD6_9AGAR|nr:hypothetical protein BDQ12DRAFT_1042 [Crucibulum laeve]